MKNNLKKCPFCGKEIKEAAIKCQFCLNWLNKKNIEDSKPEKKECPFCLNEIDYDVKSCPFCDETLEKGGKLKDNNLNKKGKEIQHTNQSSERKIIGYVILGIITFITLLWVIGELATKSNSSVSNTKSKNSVNNTKSIGKDYSYENSICQQMRRPATIDAFYSPIEGKCVGTYARVDRSLIFDATYEELISEGIVSEGDHEVKFEVATLEEPIVDVYLYYASKVHGECIGDNESNCWKSDADFQKDLDNIINNFEKEIDRLKGDNNVKTVSIKEYLESNNTNNSINQNISQSVENKQQYSDSDCRDLLDTYLNRGLLTDLYAGTRKNIKEFDPKAYYSPILDSCIVTYEWHINQVDHSTMHTRNILDFVNPGNKKVYYKLLTDDWENPYGKLVYYNQLRDFEHSNLEETDYVKIDNEFNAEVQYRRGKGEAPK